MQVLLLFDEVLNFLNRHRGMAESFDAFLQNLTVAMTGTTHGACVISLPRSQVEKWQALPQYQQTRGTLAMLAQWIAWAYRDGFTNARREPLITLGSAPLQDMGFRSTILGQLGESRLVAAIDADIAGEQAHARVLDADTKGSLRDIHRRVGTAILFESVGVGYIHRNWPRALKESGAWPLASLRQSFLNGSLTRLLDPDTTLRAKIVEFVERGEFGLASGQKPYGTYERG